MKLLRRPLLLALLLPTGALAHGGEDHGEKAAAPIVTSQDAVAAASGSVFEAVIKAPQITPGEETTALVMVSDFETNAPIKNASIDLELKDANARLFSGKAKPTRTDGIYEFSTVFPSEGAYQFDLTIQADGRADLLTLSGFTVKTPEAPAVIEGLNQTVLIIGGSAIFLVALSLGFLLGRRRPAAPRKEEEEL